MALFGKLVPTAGALLLVAGSVGAQVPAKPVCDVSASKGALAKASFAVEQARSQQGTPGAATILTSAVKQLEAAKGEDPTVQALYLGETLSMWLSQPNQPVIARRGALGFVGSPDATIDLVGSIDSLFKIVETAKPACMDITTAYRGGLPGYLTLVNGAISALNADSLDAAELAATRANKLYAASPYGMMVLGSVASKRKNEAKALEYWGQAAAVAARDSVYRDVERQVLANQGSVYLVNANVATGAPRAAAARHAIEVYTQLLAVPGTNGAFLASSRQNLQSAQLLMGDTASFVAGYQPMLANPSTYGYQDLLNTAVNVARANRSADAAKLFEAALVQNPYSRDALYNLAVVQLALDQNDKVGPVVERLVALDPSNSENYNLAARAYLARAKAAQVAKKAALAAALNDTTFKWYNRGNQLPSEVMFTEFSPSEKQLTVAGTVTDRRDKIVSETAKPAPRAKGKAAAATALAPVAVTLTIEALDKAGTVLGTQTVTTEPLSPGKTASFRTTIPATGAVAYRYRVGK